MMFELNGMPDGLKDALKHMVQHLEGKCSGDNKKGWKQVAVLKGETLTAWKTYVSDSGKLEREIDTHVAEAEAAAAQLKALKKRAFAFVEKSLDLPHDRDYKINGDKVFTRNADE